MVRQRLSLAFSFIIDVLALYGIMLLILKYYPTLPIILPFDLIAIGVAVIVFLKTVFFDK